MRPAGAALLLVSVLLLLAATTTTTDAAGKLAGKSTSPPPPSGGGGDGGWMPFGFGDFMPNIGDFKMPTNITCTEKGPCFNKTLVCPPKCFHSGKSGSASTCSLDCTKCSASC